MIYKTLNFWDVFQWSIINNMTFSGIYKALRVLKSEDLYNFSSIKFMYLLLDLLCSFIIFEWFMPNTHSVRRKIRISLSNTRIQLQNTRINLLNTCINYLILEIVYRKHFTILNIIRQWNIFLTYILIFNQKKKF